MTYMIYNHVAVRMQHQQVPHQPLRADVEIAAFPRLARSTSTATSFEAEGADYGVDATTTSSTARSTRLAKTSTQSSTFSGTSRCPPSPRWHAACSLDAERNALQGHPSTITTTRDQH